MYIIIVNLYPTHLSFLVTNILLALLPFDLSYLIYRLKSNWLALPISFVWLLFFPNTMYMITDFMHLYSLDADNARVNFALLIFGIFMGVSMGVRSADLIFERFFKQGNLSKLLIFYTVLSFVSGFAMYLGRYVRLNSWDIFTDIKDSLTQITQAVHAYSLNFVLIFGLMQLGLLLGYRALRLLNEKPTKSN
ncbi:MAG: DUF1361 domain-containing protein [Lactobacillaceae bacterium]|nr:DUF1361 domain-containing protein [Lactobacillaceae bacterium]